MGPSTHLKKLCIAVHTCNPAVERQRQKDSWSSLASQSSLISGFQAGKRPDSQEVMVPEGET